MKKRIITGLVLLKNRKRVGKLAAGMFNKARKTKNRLKARIKSKFSI